MAELGTFAPIIAGGGILDQVFSYANPVLYMGTTGSPVTTLVMGNGDTAVTPAAKVIRFTNASGANNAAANATIQAPLSTGNATPGALVLSVGIQVAGSSSTLQTAVTALSITSTTAAAVPLLNIPTGKMGFGTTPGTTAAINVDSASYAGIIGNFVNGAYQGQIQLTAGGGFRMWGVAGGATVSFGFANEAKWNVTGAAGISELLSTQNTARIVMGATNGIAFRNAANSADRLVITDAGTSAILSDGTQSGFIATSGLSGERTAGAIFGGASTSNGSWLTNGGSSSAGTLVGMTYLNTTDGQRSALEVAAVAGTGVFGSLKLMRSGGNVVIGGTAAGTTSNGVLAFSILATEPTATVDLVHIFGFDRAAGARAFACYQEAAIIAVGGAATNEWPVRLNGVNYMVQLRAA